MLIYLFFSEGSTHEQYEIFIFILEPFLCQFSTAWGLRNSSASTSTHHGS